jgi:serine phosphatase RsbU (regulator of sigma subunit)
MDNFVNIQNKFEPELYEELRTLSIDRFEKGDQFAMCKDKPMLVPIVIKGFVDVSKKDEQGKKVHMYTIEEGESCIITLNAIIHSENNKQQEGIAGDYTESIMVSAEKAKIWITKYPLWREYIFDLYGKRLNDLILQNQVVSSQKGQITDKNKRINSSIKYAARIQQAVLPSEEYMTKVLPQYFILNKPRDIVSGDFYWVEEKDNKLIIVVADSTGHGVPGAFMSMLGISMLTEIVNKEICLGANEILNELRKKIKTSLKQTGEQSEQKDGFDMAVCIIDSQTKELEFAGAYNSLYLIREGELDEIKADRMPVGVHLKEKSSFTSHQTLLQTGDSIYLFSDGFADQFGGNEQQKFKIKNFKKLLLTIHKQTLTQQKQQLEEIFDNWQGKNHQTDDVLVFGMKIN